MTHIERFAPSPTGPLHLGHAYSAITCWNNAVMHDGVFLLRIEDIDQQRSKIEWKDMIFDDLAWLGLSWPSPVLRQSEGLGRYRTALRTLWDKGLLYSCACNRSDIQSAMSAPQEGVPTHGPDGLIYPGTCRRLWGRQKALPTHDAIRLDTEMAVSTLDDPTLTFIDTAADETFVSNANDLIRTAGDIVLARKNMGTSYHLSVVIDDDIQKVSHVTRGEDLRDATPVHVLLQRLLKLNVPIFHHHKLIRDETGRRLAKRDDAKSIRSFRNEGASPQDVYKMIGITPLERT